MEYSFMEELKKANYNHQTKQQGWAYKFTENFVNNHDLTKDELQEIQTFILALEVYENPTKQMREEKISVENNMLGKIELIKNENIRGM